VRHVDLADRLVRVSRALLGWLPGGLAVATNFAGAGFAAANGSSIATTATLGKVAVPEMLRSGYNPGLATGVATAVKTAPPSEFLAFEPHQPELCGFTPTVFLDITDVYEQKLEAMRQMSAQQYLQQYYAERAAHRGNHARKVTGNADIRYAEAFQRLLPNVVSNL
jgi:LmbE family N-acetylglucosaminyl deacetylase